MLYRRSIDNILSNKAAVDEGMIAEGLKLLHTELWASITTDSMNSASFHVGKLSPAQRFGVLKLLYKKGDRRQCCHTRQHYTFRWIYWIARKGDRNYTLCKLLTKGEHMQLTQARFHSWWWLIVCRLAHLHRGLPLHSSRSIPLATFRIISNAKTL